MVDPAFEKNASAYTIKDSFINFHQALKLP